MVIRHLDVFSATSDDLLFPQPRSHEFAVYMHSQENHFYVFERTVACLVLGRTVILACIVGLLCGIRMLISSDSLTLPVAYLCRGAGHHQGLDHPWRPDQRERYRRNSVTVDRQRSEVRRPSILHCWLAHLPSLSLSFCLQVRPCMVGWHGNPLSLVVDGYSMAQCLAAEHRGNEYIVWFEGPGPQLDRQRQQTK